MTFSIQEEGVPRKVNDFVSLTFVCRNGSIKFRGMDLPFMWVSFSLQLCLK